MTDEHKKNEKLCTQFDQNAALYKPRNWTFCRNVLSKMKKKWIKKKREKKISLLSLSSSWGESAVGIVSFERSRSKFRSFSSLKNVPQMESRDSTTAVAGYDDMHTKHSTAIWWIFKNACANNQMFFHLTLSALFCWYTLCAIKWLALLVPLYILHHSSTLLFSVAVLCVLVLGLIVCIRRCAWCYSATVLSCRVWRW